MLRNAPTILLIPLLELTPRLDGRNLTPVPDPRKSHWTGGHSLSLATCRPIPNFVENIGTKTRYEQRDEFCEDVHG